MTTEQNRLDSDGAAWKRWGPYLSERAWGTVREDYSASGDAWNAFPHDHARSRTYRWNEDGLAGICDDRQQLCFALALWNGVDPILKERLFGLTGPEGNHGEDVKECYYYLDSTPTHSYMRMLYKYGQRAFPYADLVTTNAQRGKLDPEYELVDTGYFTDNQYFDIFVEYAKAAPDDMLIRISAINRGPEAAELHLLPTLWFRNTWSWNGADPPQLRRGSGGATVDVEHKQLGRYVLHCDGAPALLFTDNVTNNERLFGAPNAAAYVKDGINDCVVEGRSDAINAAGSGTKAAAHFRTTIAPGATATLRLRLAIVGESGTADAFSDFDAIVRRRRAEADEFYAALQPAALSDDEKSVQRQAFAGMLWSKQWYAYDIDRWLRGDPGQPPPPAERRSGRNRDWLHLNTADVCRDHDRAGAARATPRIPYPPRMVPGASTASGGAGIALARARHGRAALAGAVSWAPHEACAQTGAGRSRIFVRVWRALAVTFS